MITNGALRDVVSALYTRRSLLSTRDTVSQYVRILTPKDEAQTALFIPLNKELNPICHLLALLEAHHILHVSRIRVKDPVRTAL